MYAIGGEYTPALSAGFTCARQLKWLHVFDTRRMVLVERHGDHECCAGGGAGIRIFWRAVWAVVVIAYMVGLILK